MQKTFKNTIAKKYSDCQFNLPTLCPHCSTVCDPIIKSHHRAPEVYLAVLSANCCKKPFITLHKPTSSSSGVYYSELISVYPEYLSKNFSDYLENCSPRFVKLYNQAYASEQLGHLDLAGCGYRNALEVLIKDFAINFKKEDSSKVSKMKLVQAINQYYPIPEAQGLAHISRILGNDYTHYEQEYSEVAFTEFKEYVDGAIHLINLYLLSSKPLDSSSPGEDNSN